VGDRLRHGEDLVINAEKVGDTFSSRIDIFMARDSSIVRGVSVKYNSVLQPRRSRVKMLYEKEKNPSQGLTAKSCLECFSERALKTHHTYRWSFCLRAEKRVISRHNLSFSQFSFAMRRFTTKIFETKNIFLKILYKKGSYRRSC